MPRPLKLRTGLSVSTFSVTEQPSTRPSGAHGSAGVSRNTGSISLDRGADPIELESNAVHAGHQPLSAAA